MDLMLVMSLSLVMNYEKRLELVSLLYLLGVIRNGLNDCCISRLEKVN